MRLSYVTFIAQDVDLMAEFYIAALGLEEVAESRDHRYREVRGGGCMIGFAMAGVRAALNLPEAQPTGTRALLTFQVDALADLTDAVAKACAAGAELVRGAADTFFGQRQVVLRDPEGNVFRLSAALVPA